jgi:hypothetical protein
MNSFSPYVTDFEKNELIFICQFERQQGLAKSMTWRECHPTVIMLPGSYEKGKKLDALEMAQYESLIERLPGLEPWFVDIKV